MTLYNLFIEKIDKFTNTPFWKIKTVVGITLLSILFATPAYRAFPIALQSEFWETVKTKIEHPLSPIKASSPVSHAAKIDFRLTVPLIAKLFRLSPVQIYIVQFILGMFSIFMIIEICLKYSNDKVIAFLFAFGTTFTFFGRVCFTDIHSFFDGWAYFFILAALLSKNIVGVFTFSSLAAWTDERGFIAISIVVLFHWINNRFLKNLSPLNAVLNKLSISAIMSMIVYLAGRFFLGMYFGLKTPNDGANFNTLLNQIDFCAFGTWTHFEGFWLLILLFIYSLIKKNEWLFLSSSSSILIVLSLTAYMVFDITKAGSYMFPLSLVSLLYFISIDYSKQFLRLIIFICAFFSFLFPAYNIITDTPPYFIWYRPFYIKAITTYFFVLTA